MDLAWSPWPRKIAIERIAASLRLEGDYGAAPHTTIDPLQVAARLAAEISSMWMCIKDTTAPSFPTVLRLLVHCRIVRDLKLAFPLNYRLGRPKITSGGSAKVFHAMAIRLARSDEIDLVLHIDTSELQDDKLGRRKLDSFISRGGILVAEIGDKVVGYCAIRVHPNRPLGILDGVAVLESFAGQGIGKALLKAAEQEALRQRCNSLGLQVRADNHRLIEFYRREGFRKRWSLRKPDFYLDGTQAIRMRKRLRKRNLNLSAVVSAVVNLLKRR